MPMNPRSVDRLSDRRAVWRSFFHTQASTPDLEAHGRSGHPPPRFAPRRRRSKDQARARGISAAPPQGAGRAATTPAPGRAEGRFPPELDDSRPEGWQPRQERNGETGMVVTTLDGLVSKSRSISKQTDSLATDIAAIASCKKT